MWRELGNLFNTRKKKSNNSISRIIIDNKILNNDKDIANALNKHFMQIGKTLAKEVGPQEPHSYATDLKDPIDNSLLLRPTNDEEPMNEINHLKSEETFDRRVSVIKYVKQEITDSIIISSNILFR